MKWIGIARIYDKKTGHLQCRRRVYVRTEHKAKSQHGNPLYVLRFNKEDGYKYRRIDERFNVEFL